MFAKYSTEFLPKHHLVLKGQQVKLGSCYADVVFEDEKGNLVIVEIKRGILRHEALGQIIKYYGLLRKMEPKQEIRLMLVANVIPEELTAFLNEKLGVQFVEIPQSKIKHVALKHGYNFLDSEKPELVHSQRQTIKQLNSEATTLHPQVWIFQANPERYDVLNALADKSLKEDVWLVSRYKDKIRSGDIGLIWMSGKESGIYAVVDVLSYPQMMYDPEESAKYWVNESDKGQFRRRVKIRYKLKLNNDPLMRQELKNIPELKRMEIFVNARGTNFKVTNDEWKTILKLLKNRFNFKE